MPESDMQSVLRLSLPSKDLQPSVLIIESTLRRHDYYCRSRKGGSANRLRSCIPCARSKAGCDHKRPECSRCKTKSTPCHYPPVHNTPRIKVPRVHITNPLDVELTDEGKVMESPVDDTTGVISSQHINTSGDMLLDDTLALPDFDISDLGGGLFDWNDPDTGPEEFIGSPPEQPNNSYNKSSVELSTTVWHSSPPADRAVHIQQAYRYAQHTIPATPSSNVRSLIPRSRASAGTQRIAGLILSTLKSYPLMMLRHDTLPPFVHPSLVSSNLENIDTEPLANCISLVNMLRSDGPGSRRLFWKNVYMECERFSEDCHKRSRWELLAAMHAVSIYMLIRLGEGETDSNNFDFLLIKTVIVIAQSLAKTGITCERGCTLCNVGLENSWTEWIFRESRRRLGVVYRVVNMLVYFEAVSVCEMPTDLILAPLPAKKQLWEASDEFAWKAESQRDPGIHTSFGLAADGQLVKLDESRLSCTDAWLSYETLDTKHAPPRCTVNWEEWCAGIDGFGGLVLLAASLV
ncbi:hypothetical protein BX600DRAFT_435480 [Xylariales sp. PMI_506]|nr:hypothetical protein BX600DRAFT_435480 [Xylariales sp. PMI_506]